MTDVTTLGPIYFVYCHDTDGNQKIALVLRNTAAEAANAFAMTAPSMGLVCNPAELQGSMLLWSPSQDDYDAIQTNPDLVLTIAAI